MIRLRDTSGGTHEVVDKFRFIELCDNTGKVAAVFYTDNAGVMHVIKAGTPQAVRYAASTGAEFCKIIAI